MLNEKNFRVHMNVLTYIKVVVPDLIRGCDHTASSIPAEAGESSHCDNLLPSMLELDYAVNKAAVVTSHYNITHLGIVGSDSSDSAGSISRFLERHDNRRIGLRLKAIVTHTA